ncbi:hypothetical protein [uncultured Brevundimonas sp.]|uniref:hypothetical protein n=1 Tax=uncultured Brevundimonas sp. TaxID=213418 RepID=UPI0030EF573D|tara:strand:+ start:3773 stop:4180 length:408 start_codon:yes stop_codon:yes gene_type:complete
MSRLKPVFAAATLVILAPACAPGPGIDPTDPSSRRACFYQDEVSSFRPGESQSLYVRAVGADIFELRASAHCRDLDTADALAFTPMPGPPRRLCVGDHAQLSVSASISPATPCRVEVVRRLTAEQAAALPDRYRP